MPTETSSPPPRARRLGGLLLWFAATGGAIAWAVHLFLAWALIELVCLSGHQRVAGVPLEVATAVLVVGPALVTGAALAAAVVAWRRVRQPAEDVDQTTRSRARLLAVVGLWSNLLFLAIILFDGVALVVIPSCQT